MARKRVKLSKIHRPKTHLRSVVSVLVIAIFGLIAVQEEAKAHHTKRGAYTVIDLATLISRLQPRANKNRQWSTAILGSFDRLNIEKNKENICSVIAIVDQESNFANNPRVAGLSRMALAEFRKKSKQTPYNHFFRAYPDIKNRLEKDIKKARTERDLDLAARRAFDCVRSTWTIGTLINILQSNKSISEMFERMNPITTIGSMQVSVKYARSLFFKNKFEEIKYTYKLRDYMYTINGGVFYGTSRLLSYSTPYKRKIYGFADYNAGRYASRNASFQKLISLLSGTELSLDGDLLMYDNSGTPLSSQSNTEKAMFELARKRRLNLSRDQIRADFLKEKNLSFQYTHTYIRARKHYEARNKRSFPIATMPKIKLKSIKLSRGWTTELFAKRVERRYRKCIAKLNAMT